MNKIKVKHANAFKRAGGTKREYLQITLNGKNGVREVAKRETWTVSETAMAVAEYRQIADHVWKD